MQRSPPASRSNFCTLNPEKVTGSRMMCSAYGRNCGSAWKSASQSPASSNTRVLPVPGMLPVTMVLCTFLLMSPLRAPRRRAPTAFINAVLTVSRPCSGNRSWAKTRCCTHRRHDPVCIAGVVTLSDLRSLMAGRINELFPGTVLRRASTNFDPTEENLRLRGKQVKRVTEFAHCQLEPWAR